MHVLADIVRVSLCMKHTRNYWMVNNAIANNAMANNAMANNAMADQMQSNGAMFRSPANNPVE